MMCNRDDNCDLPPRGVLGRPMKKDDGPEVQGLAAMDRKHCSDAFASIHSLLLVQK
jgi:hypothetical protein